MTLNTWGHYKRITLTSTVTVTDYQLQFTVNRSSGTDSGYTLYVGTECNADYSDIRFTKSDNETELPYFIEPEYTSSAAKIWVKVDSFESGTVICMHYGNTEATTTSSISDTFDIYTTNRTSTYNISGTVDYGALCVGAVTTTSDTFDVCVGMRGSTSPNYYKCMGSTQSYRKQLYADAEGYHEAQQYPSAWVHPCTHTFMITANNDDTDFYQDGSLIRHVDYGIESTNIGLYSTALSGATLVWCGLANFATQVSAPSNIYTVNKVFIQNTVDITSTSSMLQECTTLMDVPITVTAQPDVYNVHYGRPSDYKDRKKIVLTNSATYDIDEFQVIFTVNRSAGTDSGFNVYVESNCLSTYADILFTYDNQVVPLSHYILPPNTASSSKVIVKIPYIDAGSTCTIYMYYNNPDAVSTSNKDTTVVNAITNSCCESISGWTRFNNGGYGGGYMNSFGLASDFYTEGSYSILACAYSIWSSSALTEIGQNISLTVGTPYKMYWDMRIGVSDAGTNVVTIRIDDGVVKTYTMNGNGTTNYYSEYIQFTPTAASTKLSWYANTTGSGGNTCMRIDNIILIKDITTVTVVSYTHECMALLYNTTEMIIANKMQYANVSQIDNTVGVGSTNIFNTILAVRNGDLECGFITDEWDTEPSSAWTVEASAAYTGNYGLQCMITESEYYQTYIPITIDAANTISMWFQVPMISLPADSIIYFSITLYTSGYDYVDDIYTDEFTSETESCTWINATYDVSLLSGAFLIRVVAEAYINDGGGGES
jgi:hypothetical protein